MDRINDLPSGYHYFILELEKKSFYCDDIAEVET